MGNSNSDKMTDIVDTANTGLRPQNFRAQDRSGQQFRKNQQVIGLVLAAFAGAVTARCTTTESGRSALNLMPESQMNAMGTQAFEELSGSEKEISDVGLKNKVTEIAQRIATASGANFQWEFKVFQNDQINAFCLPGGKIGIYSGILPVALTNAGLAAVIGHEVAHATLHHGNERISQSILLKFGLQAAQVGLGDSQLRTPIMAALGLGSQVGVTLPFGRFQETEADEIGLRYLAKAGYDPTAAAGLWGRMGQSKGGAEPPQWLSTHPASAQRQVNLARLAAEMQGTYSVTIPTISLK